MQTLHIKSAIKPRNLLLSKFCVKPFSSFCITMLTNQPTNKQTWLKMVKGIRWERRLSIVHMKEPPHEVDFFYKYHIISKKKTKQKKRYTFIFWYPYLFHPLRQGQKEITWFLLHCILQVHPYLEKYDWQSSFFFTSQTCWHASILTCNIVGSLVGPPGTLWTEPSFMLLLLPVFAVLGKLQTSAVKKADTIIMIHLWHSGGYGDTYFTDCKFLKMVILSNFLSRKLVIVLEVTIKGCWWC